MSQPSTPSGIETAKKRRRRFLVVPAVVLLILGFSVAPLFPASTSIPSYSLTENTVIDLLEGAGFETEGAWRIDARGESAATLTDENPGEGIRSLHIRSPGSRTSNLTITYSGADSLKALRIEPNLVLRLKVRFAERMLPGDSYLIVSSLVAWNNRTGVPFHLAVGEFSSIPDTENITSSGILFTRSMAWDGSWQDILLQSSKLVGWSVKYLRERENIPAMVSDDYRLIGLSLFPVNMEAFVDGVSLSRVQPAQARLELRRISLIPSGNPVSSVLVNGTGVEYQASTSPGPFVQEIAVNFPILRPLLRGESYNITVVLDTGVSVSQVIRIERAPIWL